MKDVPQAVLEEIRNRLVAEFDPEEIVLFGSHAWGEPNADSDLDILVKTRSEAERYQGVRAALAHRIRERGRVLYGRGKAVAGS